MNWARKQPNKGFTLVEMLVYLGILVLVSSVSVSVLVSYNRVLAEQQVKRLVTTAGASVLERMTREIRNADAVDVSSSVFGSADGVLELNYVGSNDLTFARTGNTVTVQSASAVPVALTDGEASIDELLITHFDSGISELIRVAVTVTATSSQRSATETFYGAAVVRGSYD